MYRFMIHHIFNKIIIRQNVKPKKIFSYSEFLKNNPKTTRKERQNAVKKFLDSTR